MDARVVPGVGVVAEARTRLRGVVRCTPVLTCPALSEQAGCELFLKCENLQHAGAFKYRGASHAVAVLTDEQAARGVATHSSGNHGGALALAAKRRGIPCHVVVPKGTTKRKVQAMEDADACLHWCEDNQAAREAACAEVCAATGAELVHPYDDARVVAGQSTCAAEVLEQVSDLDAIVPPVGGGGLLSGTCLAVAASGQSVHVHAAEPENADDAARSLATGVRQPPPPANTICEGLKTALGEIPWAIIKEHVRSIEVVDDDQVLHAWRAVLREARIIIEPACAVPVAAALTGVFARLGYQRVALILTGGNIDLDRIPEFLERTA